MPETKQQDHFSSAALRHYEDAYYVHQDGRLPTADHLYGFAAECASKSLMLRFTEVSMDPKDGERRPSGKPWTRHPTREGKIVEFGHVNELVRELRLLAHGRAGAQLQAALEDHLRVFRQWKVHDRYLDGTAVAEPVVSERGDAARRILSLHEQAVLDGRL